MSAGPATKMHAALESISINSSDEHARATADALDLEFITPATLEAMDAAASAEEWARQHEAEVADLMTIIFRDRPADQYMPLLAAALRLVVQERKEVGNAS